MQRRTLVRTFIAAGVTAGIAVAGALVARRPRADDAAAQPLSPAPASEAGPLVLVHKDPSCGCCTLWVTHLEQAGFTVQVFEESNMGQVKERLGVPFGKGSCHTGEVEGYLVEGHVPAADIQRLLAERPKAKGLVLPGMPIGSPGMEIPGTPAQPFVVELVRLDGETEPFSRHGPPDEASASG